MIACAAIGDSIAVGVGQARPECATTARVGINSVTYINALLPLAETGAETTIISLGVNDDSSVDTLNNLRTVRRQITSRTVYWLLPGLKDEVRADIQTVAAEHGDKLIDTRPWVGRDHLHPNGAGYQQIAAQSYGNGFIPNYPVQQFSPIEVAEAPARARLPDESPFHVDYGQMAPQRTAHTQQHELLYFFGQPHRLSSMATPRERVRNLRQTARFEARASHQGYSQSEVRMAATMLQLPTPPRQDSFPRRAAASSHGTAWPSTYVGSPAHASAALQFPPHTASVHAATAHSAPLHSAAPPSHAAARTAQACVSYKACGHSVRG